jgi:hypothetical protein
VAAHPRAGVGPLAVTADLIELPLWACRWQKPRQRVLADVAGEPTRLVTPDGEPIDPDQHTLLPRALTLTAVMRAALSDFFVHGHGGGLYDRVTEAWWADWEGDALAPAVVVSADARLSFEAPLADRRELAAAQWQAHHAPHNIDRLLKLDGPLAHEKRRLIEQVANSHDRWVRWLSFCAIHRLNDELARRYPEVVQQTDQRLAEAKQGLANRAVAEKRDWCFALYDKATLQQIRDQLRHAPATVS